MDLFVRKSLSYNKLPPHGSIPSSSTFFKHHFHIHPNNNTISSSSPASSSYDNEDDEILLSRPYNHVIDDEFLTMASPKPPGDVIVKIDESNKTNNNHITEINNDVPEFSFRKQGNDSSFDMNMNMNTNTSNVVQENSVRKGLPPLPSKHSLSRISSDIQSPRNNVYSNCNSNNSINYNYSYPNVNNVDNMMRETRVSFQNSFNNSRRRSSLYSTCEADDSSSTSSASSEEADDEDGSRRKKPGFSNNNHNRSKNNNNNNNDYNGEVLRCTSRASFNRMTSSISVSKAKSRLIDPPVDQRSGLLGKSGQIGMKSGLLGKSGQIGMKSGLIGKSSRMDDDEDDPFLGDDLPEEFTKRQVSIWVVLEWVSLVLLVAAFVCVLIIPSLRKKSLWHMELWKWLVLVLVLICGRLVSGWGIKIIVFFIERNFLLRKRVLYFVYGLKKAVQNVIWLGLVLLTWSLMFDKRVEKQAKSVPLKYVTKLLLLGEIAALIWLLKTLLVKVCASFFHVNAFFDRIQESLFNQFVIETLSGAPAYDFGQLQNDNEKEISDIRQIIQSTGISVPNDLRESVNKVNNIPTRQSEMFTKVGGSVPLRSSVGGSPMVSGLISKKQDEGITIENLHKMNQNNVSAWNMKRLIKIVRRGFLTTLDEKIAGATNEDDSSNQIRSEVQAKAAAKKMFRNVAMPQSKYIYLTDLLRFMREEEALKTMSLFEGASETERISKSAFKNWVVNAFRERRAIALTLSDTKTAVNKLHQVVNVIVIVIIILISVTNLDIIAKQNIVVLSSQIVVIAFVFGNTCKNVFESIIFLFVIHPFDVGDRCEIDGVQMIVEEMNILNTVFLRYDNQKIFFPNYVLLMKPIANYYRSPDMGDGIELLFHIATPAEKIAIIRQRIISYIQNTKEHWYPDPMIVLKDTQSMHMLKIAVWCQHRMNHQNMGERWSRRALLIEECVLILKELDIEYRVYPVNVNIQSIPPLTYTNPASSVADVVHP